MSQINLIGRQEETPPALKTSAGHRRQVPPDLLQQASRRLEILALVGVALWILGPALGHIALALSDPGDPRWSRINPIDKVAVAGVLVSLATYLFIHRRERNPALVMDLGLVYLVVCSALIGLMIHWVPVSFNEGSTRPMITWIGPLIVMFAALLPTQPWKLLLAGLIAASMDPLGMLTARAMGTYPFEGFLSAFFMHYPSYLLVGVGVVISHVVNRLGKQVAKERELGSYQLGDLIGQGGMGAVYHATHRMLARPAAIKLIHGEMLTGHDRRSAELAVARFRREANAAAQLRSPHTVELYDFGETDDGTLYLVMELLEGMDLETLVRKEGPLPQQRVIHLLRQVCDSLDEAHSEGLVHRDIKPANIHVGRVGRRHDFVKVLDFGLAKTVHASDDLMATAAGLTPGTPAYIAPEMAMGEASDGRADLYALGCVAYYLLTGQLVFPAGNGLQMISKHIQETPAPPSARTELPVSAELDRAVLACLAKRPEDRPQTAAELDRMLAEVELEPWSEEAATHWWRTHQPA